MSKQTADSFFILSPSETKSAELYQALLRGIGSYQRLGERLIQLAEQAHAFRQFDQLNELALILSNIPIRSYQAIGHYFLAIVTHRVGSGETDRAKRLFELALDTAPDVYKMKAMLVLGSIAIRRTDFESATRCFKEITKSTLSAVSLQAIRGIGILKAIEGNHTQAVKDLESVLPVIKYAPAHIYFDLLNSYAVELGEVGRRDEARNIMRVVLASPFAHAYPEWRDTANELRGVNRSTIRVSPAQYNILTLPEREPSEQRTLQTRPARVLDLARWKKKMAKKAKDKQTEQLLENMSLQDMGFKLLGLITDNRMDEDHMRIILTFVMNLLSEPVGPPDKPSA